MNRVGLEQAWLMIHHPENQHRKLRYGESKTTKSVRGTRQLEQGRHAYEQCLVIDEAIFDMLLDAPTSISADFYAISREDCTSLPSAIVFRWREAL